MRPDRRVIIIAALLAAAVLLAGLIGVQSALSKDHVRLLERQKDMAALAEEYRSLKTSVDAVGGRSSAVKVEGVVQAVDEVFRSLGLDQKVKSVKPTGSRDRGFAVEEEAELAVERVSMNEMTNILYKLENAPMVLSIRRCDIKTSFDSPSLLNLTMTLSLIKPK